MKDMQKKVVVDKVATQMKQKEEKVQAPIQPAVQKSLASGMDIKKIITIVAVVIILILGYFMK